MPDPINPLATRAKDGLPELQKLARRMCLLVQLYKPVIVAKYGDNLVIMGLIVAIEVVCGLLPEVENEFAMLDNDLSLPPADTGDTAGIDPSAGDDYPPDYEPV